MGARDEVPASESGRALGRDGDRTRVDPRPGLSPLANPAAGSGVSRGNPLAPGTFVGEYRIEELIGEGGMGTVYRAVQPLIGKKVAIKVLAGVLAKDKNAISRFVLEARAVNEIGHRNLVDIFSFGQLTDGRYYYVMDYLEGKSLGAVLRARRRLSPDDAFPLFRDIGQALEAAHEKGIVHRDLKPDNVILVPEGDGPPRAKLLDFGLAKLLETNVGGGGASGSAPTSGGRGGPKTDAGSTLGTPQYMAPEQCVGGKIDARADIYALGVMLFQTLCGRVPFDGPSLVDIWHAQVRGRTQRPAEIAPDSVTMELDALIMKMLSKRPEDRFQTAGEFWKALSVLAATGKLTPAGGSRRLPTASLLSAPAGAEAGSKPISSLDIEPAGFDDDSTGHSESSTAVEVPRPGATPRLIEAPRPDEVDDLRSALGLTIMEPAFESPDPTQVSALNISLHSLQQQQQAGGGDLAALLKAGPIRERRHLPTLSPPVPRPKTKPGDGSGMRRRSPARRIIMVMLLVVAVTAAAAAVWLRSRS